jgi:hypothetical protein
MDVFQNISDVIYMGLQQQFLTLAVTRMMHSTTHLGIPSDSPLRKIYMRCKLLTLYSLIWIVSSDQDVINPRHIGTVNRYPHSKEDFRAFMRISLQKRGLVQVRGSKPHKTFSLIT